MYLSDQAGFKDTKENGEIDRGLLEKGFSYGEL